MSTKHNINEKMERLLIGALLRRPDWTHAATNHIQPRHLWKASHGAILSALISLAERDKDTSMASIMEHLRTHRRESDGRYLVETVGGFSEVTLLVSEARRVAVGSSSELVEAYALRLRELATQREMERHLSELLHESTEPIADVAAFVDRAQSTLNKVQAHGSSAPSIAETARQVYASFEAAVSGEMPLLFSTGFKALDSMLGGGFPPALTVLAGRPGMGKTALVGNMRRRAAIKYDLGSLFISLEQPATQIVRRDLAAQARIPTLGILRGTLSASQSARLVTATATLAPLPLYSQDTRLDMYGIGALMRQTMRTDDRVKVLFIDHLEKIAPHMPKQDKRMRLEDITSYFAAFAIKNKVAVVLLSQLNRDLKSRSNKRPLLTDLRESGATEADARRIILLYRDDYYDARSEARGIAELNLAKNNEGQTGIVTLRAELEFMRFESIPRESAAAANYGGVYDA